MNKPRIVYIASPVRAVYDAMMHLDDAHNKTIELARKGCAVVKTAGHIPLSPVLVFDGVFDENLERDAVMEACFALLAKCDEIYVVQSTVTANSKGIKAELALAKKLGITEVEYV
jgi:hypothetical protein